MIILVTGATHTGKTLLAQRLLEKYHFPYLSIDHLKMGLIRSGKTSLTTEDDDELTSYLWPILREMIRTAVENRQNLIVEGCYIPFDWRRDFDGRYLPDIRFICLVMTDDFIERNFDRIRAHSSDIECRLDDSDCSPTGLKADNKRVMEGFLRAGEQIAFIDGDYEKNIGALVDCIEP